MESIISQTLITILLSSQPVFSTNLCLYGRVGLNSIINGLYIEENIYDNKPYYKKTGGSCGTWYMYWRANKWAIDTTLSSSGEYYARCSESSTASNCHTWYVSNGASFVLDSSVQLSLNSCPSWNCDAITIPNAPNNCGSFDENLGNGLWKDSNAARWWYFDDFYFRWFCADHPPTYSCSADTYPAYLQPGWTDLSKGQSAFMQMESPNTDFYTVNCIDNNRPPSNPPTYAPTSLAPTNHPSTSPTKSPSNSPTSLAPTNQPSISPTKLPSNAPTTLAPTNNPSLSPTLRPTETPTGYPTTSPTTTEPTTAVPTTSNPSNAPTFYGQTSNPSRAPTSQPTTFQPTSTPTTAVPTTAVPTTSNPTTSQPTTVGPTTAVLELSMAPTRNNDGRVDGIQNGDEHSTADQDNDDQGEDAAKSDLTGFMGTDNMLLYAIMGGGICSICLLLIGILVIRNRKRKKSMNEKAVDNMASAMSGMHDNRLQSVASQSNLEMTGAATTKIISSPSTEYEGNVYGTEFNTNLESLQIANDLLMEDVVDEMEIMNGIENDDDNEVDYVTKGGPNTDDMHEMDDDDLLPGPQTLGGMDIDILVNNTYDCEDEDAYIPPPPQPPMDYNEGGDGDGDCESDEDVVGGFTTLGGPSSGLMEYDEDAYVPPPPLPPTQLMDGNEDELDDDDVVMEINYNAETVGR